MSFLSKLFYGVDLDEEQKRNDELNAQLAAENLRSRDKYAAEYGEGFADNYYAQAEAHRLEGNFSDVSGEVSQAFDEGLAQGADNIRNAVGNTINRTVGSAFSIIPWQVWIAAGVFAAFYFGLIPGRRK